MGNVSQKDQRLENEIAQTDMTSTVIGAHAVYVLNTLVY